MKPVSQTHALIGAKSHDVTAQALSMVLADTYVLALKTQNFHWNVTGPQFSALHTLFEQQYTELFARADLIAERIRAIGYPAPGSYKLFSELTAVQEETGQPSAEQMVQQLVDGHLTIVRSAERAVCVAKQARDHPTVDMMVQRIDAHQKAVWMLQAFTSV